MATGLAYSVAACEYTTTAQVPDETDIASKIQLFQIHASSVHQGGGAARTPGVKAKMEPPKLQPGVDQQTWDQFIASWSFRRNVPPEELLDSDAHQLEASDCLGEPREDCG